MTRQANSVVDDYSEDSIAEEDHIMTYRQLIDDLYDRQNELEFGNQVYDIET